MHNIISSSQLNEWRHFEQTLDECEVENQKINDYYECLIECDVLGQHVCKSICKGYSYDLKCINKTTV